MNFNGQMTLDELKLLLPGRTIKSVPGIVKLGQVSIMLQIWHMAFMHFLGR